MDTLGAAAQQQAAPVQPAQSCFELKGVLIVSKEVVSSGGYGEVCIGTYFGTKVAIKVRKRRSIKQASLAETEDQDHLAQEALMLARYRHPNIVCLFGSVNAENGAALVTEFCARGSLDKVLHSRTNGASLDLLRKLEILCDVARAVAFLHGQCPAVLHCDVKSANVLLTSKWVAKLADFGLARLQARRSTAAGQGGAADQNGTVDVRDLSTVQYSAPEVLQGAGFSKASDIYSFGVLMWEVLEQRRPYCELELNIFALAFQIGNGTLRLEPVAEQTCTSSLAALCHQCLSTDPGMRPEAVTVLKVLEHEAWVMSKAVKRSQGMHQLEHRKEFLDSHSPLNSPRGMDRLGLTFSGPAYLQPGANPVGQAAAVARRLQDVLPSSGNATDRKMSPRTLQRAISEHHVLPSTAGLEDMSSNASALLRSLSDDTAFRPDVPGSSSSSSHHHAHKRASPSMYPQRTDSGITLRSPLSRSSSDIHSVHDA